MEVVDGDTESGGSGGGGGIYLSGELWICDIVSVISFFSWEWKGIFGMYAEEEEERRRINKNVSISIF